MWGDFFDNLDVDVSVDGTVGGGDSTATVRVGERPTFEFWLFIGLAALVGWLIGRAA